MKKKERYKILNYAKKQYSEEFKIDYQFKRISKSTLLFLLEEYYNASEMCEWSYCCYGMYTCCWQDLTADGVWNMTQEDVNKSIAATIKNCMKYCKKDNRILYAEREDCVEIVLVMRDIMAADYLITFKN